MSGSTYSPSQGPAGPQGPQGPGVPTGGTAGQLLEKIDGTDYNTQWVTPSIGPSVDFVAYTYFGGF